MISVVLRATCEFVPLIIALFSVLMLLRGHNDPGGGFIGGLLMAMSFAIHLLAFDVRAARVMLRVSPHALIGLGLLLAAGSGLLAMIGGAPYMTGLWLPYAIPGVGKLSTILLFDIGVFMVVWGAVVLVLYTLSED